MEREYDLFEQLPDGSPMWRCHAVGLPEARRKLEELGKSTVNECFAMHLPTREIVARSNVRSSRGRKPMLFQITYDHKRALARIEILKLHGYEVVTVIGNEAAKVILGMRQDCDLFIVGHAAPDETRREMVQWLKANCPGIQILALNPPSIRELSGADYNAKLNGPETLLPLIATAVASGGRSDTSAIK